MTTAKQPKRKDAIMALTMNTIAFTVCFACWMTNGVLITFLVDRGIYTWDKAQIGWLIGIPVLTGALMRLPVGLLTDKYGGKVVFGVLMLLAAIPMYTLSMADSYQTFFWASLGFGLTGASFAVGIAYTSVWFPKEQQGTALGIFGAGNAVAALTSMGAPTLLRYLTDNGANLDGWRTLPKIYAAALVVMAVIFFLTTKKRLTSHGTEKSLGERLAPLRYMRVWRFGLYYFLVFGGFVALAQWLVPYYVNAYGMTVVMAGLMTTIFSLPSGVVRALGGWMSDRWGARSVMYWVLGLCAICCVLLIVPRMDIYSPGQGVMATRGGEVTKVEGNVIEVDGISYTLKVKPDQPAHTDLDSRNVLMPRSEQWQEAVVKVGDTVAKKQLLAKGVTHIYFQANVWVFTFLVFVIGFMMGIGKAAVYKHIPVYFPEEVGVVGGIVGVVGGLGGFVCPIIFGYLIRSTGLWTTCWMFFAVVSLVCLIWMHLVVKRILRREAPHLSQVIEDMPADGPGFTREEHVLGLDDARHAFEVEGIHVRQKEKAQEQDKKQED